MTSTGKITGRAIFQYLLIVAIVFCLGLWAQEESEECNEKRSYNTQGLPITEYPAGEYPEIFLGSEEAWENHIANISEPLLYVGEGKINNQPVTVKFVLQPNGTIVGRYHNTNGVDLDLNGFVETSSGNLNIHLGHASDRTLSNWKLTYESTDDALQVYEFSGVWGKKELPSQLTIRRMEN